MLKSRFRAGFWVSFSNFPGFCDFFSSRNLSYFFHMCELLKLLKLLKLQGSNCLKKIDKESIKLAFGLGPHVTKWPEIPKITWFSLKLRFEGVTNCGKIKINENSEKTEWTLRSQVWLIFLREDRGAWHKYPRIWILRLSSSPDIFSNWYENQTLPKGDKFDEDYPTTLRLEFAKSNTKNRMKSIKELDTSQIPMFVPGTALI